MKSLILASLMTLPSNPTTVVPRKLDFYDKLSTQCGISSKLLKSMAKVESSENPKALSPDGSYGLFQIQYQTAKFMGYRGSVEGLYNPETNGRIACKYIRYLQSTRMHIWKSLDAYNRGPVNESKSPWVGHWEDHKYVGKIISKMEEENDVSNTHNE